MNEVKVGFAFIDESVIFQWYFWIRDENKELVTTKNWGLANKSERFTLKLGLVWH